jgi:penicillin-binding protein, 1A family
MNIEVPIEDRVRPTPTRPPPRKRRTRRRRRRWLRLRDVLNAALLLSVTASIAIMLVVGAQVRKMPDSSEWVVPDRAPNIRVLARNGSLISNRGQTGGEEVGFADLPWYVPAAFIAAEDRRFREHFGVDLVGLASVLLDSVRAGSITRGASTITQQVAKNLFLTSDPTLSRKIQEAVLALWLEREFTKDQILELYLNRIYFGSGATGIEAAAQVYFAKSARNLSLGQAAILAGLLPAPSAYNPKADPELAKQRQQLTLSAMVRDGAITPTEAEEAYKDTDADVVASRGSTGHYVADWVEALMMSYIGKLEGDVVVYTTIDHNLQSFAERTIRDYVRREGGNGKFNQGALVSLDASGEVLAMVGGADYARSQFNRAVTARRQPGSTFKPIVYAAALEKGYSPDTVAEDARFDFDGWSPRNDGDRYHGMVNLRDALAYSFNTVAARLAIDVTPQAVIEMAARLGISTNMLPVPSIGLGTAEVSLLELTAAFVPFANKGFGVVPSVIERIETKNGLVLYQKDDSGPGRVLSPLVVSQMNDMLVAAVRNGTGHRAGLVDWEVGGKTGTSQNLRDASFVGYTAKIVTGVWLGRDDDRSAGIYGGTLPVAIWTEFMERAHAKMVPVELPGYRLLQENYVVQYAMDSETGLPAINKHTGAPVIEILARSSAMSTP